VQIRASLAVLIWLGLAGCGYVGPVLAPSPELPQSVADLNVVERGDRIVITFSTPARTTDNLAIGHFSQVDLRIGPAAIPFDFDRWAASAKRYDMEPPPAADRDNPVPVIMTKDVPAADWLNKRVAIAVRTAVKRKNHYSSWSNRVVLNVIPPLAPPEVLFKSTAQGILLTWHAERPELEYRIYRKSATDNAPLQLGISKTPEYLDTTSQYDAPYDYTVVAASGLTESLPSEAQHVVAIDKFPPSVPTGITALGAPNSIELSWQRSPESDLKGYFVYRSVNGAPYQQVGELLTLPAYSDHQVERGKTYSYEVNSIDQKNNASDKSAPVEVRY
jgi:fibronectin type 3 domain-containing protein